MWTILLAAIAASTALTVVPSPASGQTAALRLDVDVAAFSARAEAWRQANVAYRQTSLIRAEEMALDAKDEEAAEEARQRAAAAIAAAAATTAAPVTTAPPSTPPPTTPPTTSIASDTPTTLVPEDSTTTTTSAPPVSGGPTAEQWAALRMCESGGRYDALSPGGRYRGAYQFSPPTWDWVAGIARPDLVGVDPAAAAPADQDELALALYNLRGASPWPHCGVHLG